jgi:hypothetical protein
MPSWCLKPDQWLQNSATGQLEEVGGHLFESYKSCGDLKINVVAARVENDGELRIHGRRVDRITCVHDISDFLEDMLSSTTHWSSILLKTREFCNKLNLPSKYSATDQPIVEVILSALCVNEFWIESPKKKASFRRGLLYKAYKEHVTGALTADDVTLGAPNSILEESQLFEYMASRFTFAELPADNPHIDEQLDKSIPYSFLERQAITELSTLVQQRIGNRRLIMTSKGYIGFGLQTCSVSDEICLIPGSDVPLILREMPIPNKEHMSYVFVGDAYIHGLMYGEGMDQCAEASFTPGEEQNGGMQLLCIR